MKLYIVSSDIWTEGWGTEICIMGVFDNKEMAQKCFEKYKREYPTDINEIMLNEDNLVNLGYLGGYIE